MLLFTTRENLELQSVPGQKTSQIVFRNKILTRGPDFARNLWQTAKQYCETYYHSDSLCVVVEHPSYVSVWKESEPIEIAIKDKQKTESIAEPERASETELNAEQISYCQQELAEAIGPISALICERVVAENPHLKPKEFIKALAKQIPDRDRAEQFERDLLASL